MELKFDYTFKANEAPFNIQSIYHDDRFTYIQTNAQKSFPSMRSETASPTWSPTTFVKEPTYSQNHDNGYVELGKKRMEFSRSTKG